MNNFVFKEAPSFIISEKYIFDFLGVKKNVTVKRGLLDAKTEFKIKFDDKKGSLKIKSNHLLNTVFEGYLGTKRFKIKQTGEEINVNYENVIYDFIFQKGLVTGIFVEDQNIGIIKQKSNVKFGLEEYFGIIEKTIPEEVLIMFLVLFNKIYSKDGYLHYKHKGFTSIKPRLQCNPSLAEKLGKID